MTTLHERVERVLDARPDLVDPRAVARVVAAGVPARDAPAALAEALPDVVRGVIQRRRAANPLLGGRLDPTKESSPPTARTRRRGVRRTQRSATWDAVRASWLDERVHGASGWTTLGDMTAVDLRFAAEYRRKLADANRAKAARFARLAELLAEHGVARVRDLPEEVLDEVAVERLVVEEEAL